MRNIQFLEKMLAPTQVGCSDVVGEHGETSSKRCELFVRDLVMMSRTSGNRYTYCASKKICLKILRDHLAVQAASVDSLEKCRLTIEKFLEPNVHGSGASPMDIDALAKTKGGKKGGKGKDKESMSKKFDGNCFWCGAHSHRMEDCQKKVVGMPQAPKSLRGSDPKPKGKGKGSKGKKGSIIP